MNTAVSHFMILTNELKKQNCQSREVLEVALRLIAPFAPFLSEHLWNKMGNTGSIHHTMYPEFDASLLVEDSYEYPLCINGKKRATLSLPTNMSKEAIESAAKSVKEMDKWLVGKNILKVIVVPNKMVNFVVK